MAWKNGMKQNNYRLQSNLLEKLEGPNSIFKETFGFKLLPTTTMKQVWEIQTKYSYGHLITKEWFISAAYIIYKYTL
jgi:hypothetical protein